MKNILIIKMLLFTHFFAFSQIMVAPNENSGRTNGTTYITHKNGKLAKAGKYDSHGKETGKWKFYTLIEDLESIGYYKSGQKHGEWKDFYANGKTLKTGNYEKGKRKGECSLVEANCS
ncbi:toxin-antitoxin system YwqK family antitoxin [Paenimyroides aestuarii]|uniref:MORN repeat protein n=1 Tax=Paenimyroides aestuarii TaxID=2968490 RepID=A0ABY5NUN8_9FLAO|nr:hypothetical protein [Paenimyroides aestuarii]UUV22310.1 hypothetical protein NPX36_04545 [Paenimyroides aestuarii]